jgi:peptidoglycan/LPS O-acetylase OafA/YrhL
MSDQEGVAGPAGRDKRRLTAGGPGVPERPALRLAYLDGLRALAAAYVVVFHAVLGFSGKELNGPWRILRRACAFGHEAVAIFIVLSGYCLMLPVVRKDAARLPVDFATFIKRRALRILPPYFAALLLSLGLIAALPVLGTPDSGTIWDDSLPALGAGPILSHLLVVHNWSRTWGYQINGPLWSVASEWQIYFFFPLVLLPVWRKVGMVPALLGAALLGYAPLALWPTSPAAQVAITWYLLLFAFGMAAAAIGFSPDALATRLRTRVPIRWICAGLWAFCLVFGWGFGPHWFRMKPLADLLVGLSTAVMLVYLTGRASAVGRARGTLLRVLESRPLVGLGHFSYSLYLTHLPVVALCYFALRERVAGPQLALALVVTSFPTSLVVAYAFHVAVERRFIRR